MTAKKKRTQTWLALILVAFGLVPVAIMGLFVCMSAMATPLHPNPQDVPSVAGGTPLGMDDTSADAEPVPDRAIYYFPRFAADPRYGPQEPTEVDYSCFAGSSAFLSTPSDLVRFPMAINSGKLLQPATVQLVIRVDQPITDLTPDATATGLGAGDGLRSWLGPRDRRADG